MWDTAASLGEKGAEKFIAILFTRKLSLYISGFITSPFQLPVPAGEQQTRGIAALHG